MVRASVTAALLALALAGAACTPAHAPAVRKAGMVMSLGGVGGIVGAAFASGVTESADEMLIGFEVVSAIGILSYAYAEITWPRVRYIEETPERRHHRWAKILTERAAGAAREGRCARVRRLEVRVQKYDRDVHDGMFMKDTEILKCLNAPPAAPAPETEAPSLDVPGTGVPGTGLPGTEAPAPEVPAPAPDVPAPAPDARAPEAPAPGAR